MKSVSSAWAALQDKFSLCNGARREVGDCDVMPASVWESLHAKFPLGAGGRRKALAVASEGRERVGNERCVGIVIEWRGYMGWIEPLMRIKHEKAARHQGRIYLAVQDVLKVDGHRESVKEGRIVDFFVYADAEGLGAEACRPRHALRLTMPHREAKSALKQGGTQWSDYLKNSEYYPMVETEYGVLARKYDWELNFAVVELWGHSEELAAAAIALCVKGRKESQRLENERRETEGADAAQPQAKPSLAEVACHLRLLVPEAEVAEAVKVMPGAQASPQAVVECPVSCCSVVVEGAAATVSEAVKQFVIHMAALARKADNGAQCGDEGGYGGSRSSKKGAAQRSQQASNGWTVEEWGVDEWAVGKDYWTGADSWSWQEPHRGNFGGSRWHEEATKGKGAKGGGKVGGVTASGKTGGKASGKDKGGNKNGCTPKGKGKRKSE